MSAYVPVNQLGRGSTLSWTPDGGSIVAFASLISITPAAPTVGEIEGTLLASTFEPYDPTIPAAEMSFKVRHWDNDPGCVAMQAACRVAPVPKGAMLLTLSTGATLSYHGFPKKYAIGEVTNKAYIEADIDFRLDQPHTYTPAPDPT